MRLRRHFRLRCSDLLGLHSVGLEKQDVSGAKWCPGSCCNSVNTFVFRDCFILCEEAPDM